MAYKVYTHFTKQMINQEVLFLTILLLLITSDSSFGQHILQPLIEVRGISMYEDSTHTSVWGESLGRMIIGVGDVNGDSLADYAVTSLAPFSKYWKRAKFYLGSKTGLRDTVYKTIPSGNNIIKGDFNGDGIIDLITSTAGTGQNIHDSLYIYLGKRGDPFPFDTIPSVKIVTESSRYEGRDNISVGDLNGDRKDDFVTSLEYNKQRTGRGGVKIYFGRDSIQTEADVELEAEGRESWYAKAFAVGDLNGDGFSDLALVWSAINTKPETSYCAIYFGANNFSPQKGKPDIIVNSTNWPYLRSGTFGWESKPLFVDINSDGVQDMIVFLPDSNYSATNVGRVYYFFGSKGSFDLVPDFVLSSQPVRNSNSGLGGPVAVIDDVNADGNYDILIHGTTSGMVSSIFVYLGGHKLSRYPSALRSHTNSGFGLIAGPVGDVNGDGVDDFGVAVSSDGSGFPDLPQLGTFWIYSGDRNLTLSTQSDKPATEIREFNLLDPYPNPFHPTITIPIEVDRPTEITFIVRTILGEEVQRSRQQYNIPGLYLIPWDGVDKNQRIMPSGVYIVEVLSSMQQQSKKVALVR